MKKFLLAFAFILLIVSSVFCQDARPVPTATPVGDNDVVRISTNLIQVDVTVTDSKGKPVADLRPDEVEIFENGKKRKITNFSFHAGVRTLPAEEKKGSAAAKAAVLPSGPARPEAVRRSVAIVYDDLHLSFSSSFFAKEALKTFIKENTQDGDLIAIIRTGTGAGALQQFTTDRRQMLAAVDRLRYNHHAGVTFLEPMRDSVLAAQQVGKPGSTVGRNETEESTLPKDLMAIDNLMAGTFAVLTSVVRNMSELPGRKSVVLLTDALGGRPSLTKDNPYGRLIDLANRSSVSFYPVEVKGLVTLGISADDDVTDISLEGNAAKTDHIVFGDSGRARQIANSQTGLLYLAEKTGGLARINNNDIRGGLRRALEDQSYYLIAYEPDEDTFDPRRLRYNSLEVKVNRPGVRVRYRNTFLNISEERLKRNEQPQNALLTAITSPFASDQIDVRMNAIFASDAGANSSVRSFINIDTSGLSFTQEATGLRKTSFDLVAVTFGALGEVIDQRARNFTVSVTPEQHEMLRQRGLVAAFDLPVKNAGGYQVRLAVRDNASGRIGSAHQYVEVPAVKNGKLVLSGMILSSGAVSSVTGSEGVSLDREDPLRYTSLREFRRGAPLQFFYFVYNPKVDRDKKPKLAQNYRLYKDNQLIFASPERQIPVEYPQSQRMVGVSGGIMLGADLLPGDYVLEVIVRDQLNKDRTATQFIQFEIVG